MWLRFLLPEAFVPAFDEEMLGELRPKLHGEGMRKIPRDSKITGFGESMQPICFPCTLPESTGA